jgi:hypothetical protein
MRSYSEDGGDSKMFELTLVWLASLSVAAGYTKIFLGILVVYRFMKEKDHVKPLICLVILAIIQSVAEIICRAMMGQNVW